MVPRDDDCVLVFACELRSVESPLEIAATACCGVH